MHDRDLQRSRPEDKSTEIPIYQPAQQDQFCTSRGSSRNVTEFSADAPLLPQTAYLVKLPLLLYVRMYTGCVLHLTYELRMTTSGKNGKT